MPKKTPKNAFFYYMLDYKHIEEKSGVQFPGGLKDVALAASPSWNKMNAAQKKVYETKANQVKNKCEKANEIYTSQGIPYSSVQREKNEEARAEHEMKNDIYEIIHCAALNKNLDQQLFYFISFNYFCKNIDNTYLPAEVSLLKYNLENGICDEFHSFINPGPLPLGMAYTATEHSKKKHGLPIPPYAMGQKDSNVVLELIKKFLLQSNETSNGKLPPLFTLTEQVTIAKSILTDFCFHAREDENIFKVYPLPELLFTLKKTTSQFETCAVKSLVTQSVNLAKAILDRDQYEHKSGIACEVHEEMGKSQFCTLSQVKRWSFMISEICTGDLGIDFIPGKHLPGKYRRIFNRIDNGDDDETMSIISTSSSRKVAPWKEETFDCSASEVGSSNLWTRRDNEEQGSVISAFTSLSASTSKNPWSIRMEETASLPPVNLDWGRGKIISSVKSENYNFPVLPQRPGFGRGNLL